MNQQWLRRLLAAAVVAPLLLAGEGAPFPRLRAVLLHANPALRVPTRARAARAAGVRPWQPAIRAVRFWRRVGPIVWDYKRTEWWLRRVAACRDDPARRAATWDALHTRHAPAGLRVILDLRGLYVKIGQVLSARADFIPRQYVDAFATLQDEVPPYERTLMEGIIRESLRECPGVEMEDVFESFGEVLGSASIGQVHRAKLTPRYGGGTVAVKCMHPNAEELFRHDFKVFRTLVKVALPGWDPILRELEWQMMTQFDFGAEAQNLETVRRNMAKSPYAAKVCVPRPMIELSSKRVLVMEYLSGKKLADTIEENLAEILGGDVAMARRALKAKQRALFESRNMRSKNRHPGFWRELNEILGDTDECLAMPQKIIKALQLTSLTRDARNKLSLLMDATGHQIFQDGVYNADPHPGNVLVLDCGRLGLIDYGQTCRLTRHDRLALAEVVDALGRSRTNTHEIATAMRSFGFKSRDSDDTNLAHFAALYFDSDARGKQLGYPTPQKYLVHLNSVDPLTEVPDPAVFVARTSFLFRGLGALLQQQLHTSRQSWSKHAQLALTAEGVGRRPLYNLGLTPA